MAARVPVNRRIGCAAYFVFDEPRLARHPPDDPSKPCDQCASSKAFDTSALNPARENDFDADDLLQIALGTLPPDDWAARPVMARAYWPAASRWRVVAAANLQNS